MPDLEDRAVVTLTELVYRVNLVQRDRETPARVEVNAATMNDGFVLEVEGPHFGVDYIGELVELRARVGVLGGSGTVR